MKVRRHPERTRGLRLAVLIASAFALVLSDARLARADATIGLYTDTSGNTCSFSGNSPGLVTAYVVVHPDLYGVSAVQFAAQIPACLGATYVSESVPPGMLSVGDSQNGISIALQNCSQAVTSVLAITYQLSGSTTPCCEFELVADPTTGSLAATGCAFQDIPITSVTSHFHADASCACEGNSPPLPPTNPSPFEGQFAVNVNTNLSWFGFDADDNLVGFDLYLGTSPSPALLASGLTSPSYDPPSPLSELTTYYWRVVAHDARGIETSGPVWSFTTRAGNTAPFAPQLTTPANGEQGVSLQAVLRWVADDIDGDPLVFDVYFGTTNPPALVASNVAAFLYDPPSLDFSTTYYWRIVARDPLGLESTSVVRSFVTRPVNFPPNAPTPTTPPDASTDRPVTLSLGWTQTDLDPDTLESDLYFGTSSTPPLVASGLSSPSYSLVDLPFATKHYWRVVVRDHHGAETSGPTWSFTTRPANYPPVQPFGPSPSHFSTNQSENSTLAWECSDLDGHAITYDVYFGTTTTAPLVASNVPTKSFNPGPLAFGLTYRWRIVARDALGATTSGPTWLFTTRTNSPPTVPCCPVPSDNATNRLMNQTLSWFSNDPNGHTVTYDVYFGTTNPPPLVATNHPTNTYNPGPLGFTTTYRWQIVARDPYGAQSTGPVWTFTTKSNVAPFPASNPSPPNNGAAGLSPVLTWSALDPDGQPLTYYVFFGNTNPPPLVATGLTVREYDPGDLATGTYYWRVDISDGTLTTSGATWSFVATTMGDANLDGSVTLADASCAFDAFLGSSPCVGNPRADVDCSGMITPRDARCIHLHVLNGSCVFCGEGALAPSISSAAIPFLFVGQVYDVGDTVIVQLRVGGVPSLSAFGFFVQCFDASLVRASRSIATAGFTELGVGSFGPFAWVGGYGLSGAPADAAVSFIDLRFVTFGGGSHAVVITNYVDDLSGASDLTFHLDGGGGVPVLITNFRAQPGDRGVDVSWELRADEAMESYTLYRREEGAVNAIVVSQGPATTHSFLDTSVESGKTYHYELLVRTLDGDEFRSRIATASTRASSLILGQNHPNPFNPQTVIPYELPVSSKSERVRLWILDISGRVVKTLVDENQAGGSYRVEWTGKDDRGESVSSGVYFYVLDVGGERRTRKLVLLK